MSAGAPLVDGYLESTNPASFARGKEVFVYERGTKVEAQLYADEALTEPITQPLITDKGGRPRDKDGRLAWVDPAGTYDVEIDGEIVPWNPPAAGPVDLSGYQQTSAKGAANGYASLEAAGKVPVAQLPSALMEYQGTWNASTNTPKLEDGKGGAGDVYRVSVAGERDLGSGKISFEVGDYAIYNGSVWEKSDTTDAVASVNGKTGTVTGLEETANKDTDGTLAANSDTKYPSQKAVKTYADAVKGLLPFVNVKDTAYGAKGDDTTDDTAAFQAAHDALPASGGVVFVPPATYKLAGTVACTKPVVWSMRGATIRRSTAAPMLTFSGSVGSDANLSADVAKGATVLKLTTTGLAAGDYLNLRSNKSTGAPSGSTYGEIVQVNAITSGTELTVRAPIAAAYAKADTARVAKLTLLSGCAIIGGRFTQNEALTKDTTKGFVNFLYTRGARVIDTEFEHQEQFALQFEASIDWRVERPVLRDMLFNEAEEQYAYGILARGPSQGGEVIGAVGESAQIFNTGGTTRGIPRHCRVNGKATGNHPTTVAKSPFSLHSDCAFITLDRCEVDGWGDIGIQIKGTDHLLIAPRVARTFGIGIFLIADSKTIYPERVRIVKPVVTDVKEFEANIGIGIAVQGIDHEIDAPSIADTDAHGISINRSGSAEPCSGTVVKSAVVRNYSRGNPSAYNAIRLGTTGVTNIHVLKPFALAAPEGARAYRFEGGEANTGCILDGPRVESGLTNYGSTEEFAIADRLIETHTFAIQGAVTAVTIPGLYPGIASGEIKHLVKARYKITAGTKVKCKLQKNGEDATGFTGIEAKTEAAQKEGSVSVASATDLFTLVIESVEGSPENLTVTLFFERLR